MNASSMRLDAKTKLVARVAFAGDFGDPDSECDIKLDVDRAADELRQAGYRVFRFPKEHSGRLAHPLDDFIEAHIAWPDDPQVVDAVCREVEGIVHRYGGSCYECGRFEPGEVPFADLFG